MIRKVLGTIFAFLTVLVAVATVAYACVPFKSNLVVDAPGKTGGTVRGFGGSHEYCDTNLDSTGDLAGPGNVHAAATKGNLITVTVSAGTCTSLLGGNHSVILNNAKSAAAVPFKSVSGSWSFVNGKGCFNGAAIPEGNVTLTTNFSVNGSGAGASVGVFSLGTTNRTDGAAEASSLCVGSGSGALNQGIFAPIRITHV